MTRICILLTMLVVLSCNEKKDTPVVNNAENTTISKEEYTQNPTPPAIKKYAFSEIVYTRFSKVYVPKQDMGNYTIPEYSKIVEEDFVNLGKIEEITTIPNGDSKYKYLDAVEERVRGRFNYSNGMTWKIKSRELYVFDTYTEASKRQLKIRGQETPKYSD
jgi:hypothetical protein